MLDVLFCEVQTWDKWLSTHCCENNREALTYPCFEYIHWLSRSFDHQYNCTLSRKRYHNNSVDRCRYNSSQKFLPDILIEAISKNHNDLIRFSICLISFLKTMLKCKSLRELWLKTRFILHYGNKGFRQLYKSILLPVQLPFTL